MPAILLFLFKLSISLAVVWIFYQLFLRRLTFYRLNRWYLLGYTILSFFIPLINIGPMLTEGAADEPLVIQYIPVIGGSPVAAPLAAARQPGVSGWEVLLWLLAAGAAVLLARSLLRWYSLVRLRRQARPIGGTGMKIYQVDAPIIPFSFGNAIYINQHLHTEKEWTDIILHEYVHIRQQHTVDILLAELLCILNWYNPFAWLIRYSIRQNLEFIADQQVLAGGVDKKGYQYHLLKVVGEPQYRLANNFNFSSLKKRIVMMNKIRSARVHLLKLLFLLPLVAVLLVAFRDQGERLFGSHHPVYVNAAGIAISLPERTPMEGVVVRDRVTGLQTTTDVNGYYKLQIPFNGDPGRVDLDYRKPGYDPDYRGRSFPLLKETVGMLDIAALRPVNAPGGGGLFIGPSFHPVPADPGYTDAVNELHRALKESDDLMRYMQMQKDHPEVSLFYMTEDRQKEIIVHTDGTIERYGYPGTPGLDEMNKKYGDMQGYMATSHPTGPMAGSGYLARWAAISEQAAAAFHRSDPAVRQIIFPGDSRVIVVPVSGKPRFYDMDNDAGNERAEFERLYGKLPDCVPGAGFNSDVRQGAAGGPARPAAGVRDTVPDRGVMVIGRDTTAPGDTAGRRQVIVASRRPLYIVDGRWMPPGWRLDSIPGNRISSINYIDHVHAVQAYGPRAMYGAALITTVDAARTQVRVIGRAEKVVYHQDTLRAVSGYPVENPLYIVDGKEITADSMRKLPPDDILAVTILKDSAVNRYGAKGRHGVVEIATRRNRIAFALFMVNGVEVAADSALKLDPNDIESVNVLKPAAARAQYGEKGKNGAVLITLKGKGSSAVPPTRRPVTAVLDTKYGPVKITADTLRINGSAGTGNQIKVY